MKNPNANLMLPGWTFVETLVVIAIVMILTGMVSFFAFRNVDQAMRAASQTHIESYSLALNAYYVDNRTYPTTQQGLEALWTQPYTDPSPRNWSGPYIDRAPEPDPWGNEYEYRSPGENGLPFSIQSFGADGLPGGEGNNADIKSWE